MAANLTQGDAADGGDAVIALLPMHRAVDVSGCFEHGVGEVLFLGLDLLQAQHVRRFLRQEPLNLIGAQTDGIEVPGSDRDHAHRHRVANAAGQWGGLGWV